MNDNSSINNHINRMNDTHVIVIDAGHGGTGGGSDDGAIYNGVTERYINMATAKAMYEELSNYEDVQVYLTHDDVDKTMTLKERAEFAKSVNADYLISIHYNASESHAFYGSEVWIPSIGRYYVEGYQLADIIISEFRDMGLHIRGIKTRVGDGDDEYYGIIRESEWRGITGIIVEHCHVDNLKDQRYFDSGEDYIEFGKADATAAAKYFGLKSTVLGVDYSSYKKADVAQPAQRVYQDTTPPEQCEVRFEKGVQGNGSLEFTIEGIDSESQINYYAYSFDGGNHFSDLFEWYDTDGDNRENIIVTGVNVDTADFVARVYNNYNLYTDSAKIRIEGINAFNQNGTAEQNSENDSNKNAYENSGHDEMDENNIQTITEKSAVNEEVWYNRKGNITSSTNVTGVFLIAAGIGISVFLWRISGKGK